MTLRPKNIGLKRSDRIHLKEKKTIDKTTLIKEKTILSLTKAGIRPKRITKLSEQEGVRIFLHDKDVDLAKRVILKEYDDARYYPIRNRKYSPHIEVYGL